MQSDSDLKHTQLIEVSAQALLTTQLESGNWRNRTTTWRLNSQPTPELTAYTRMQSFSYASHQCGRNSPTPNCRIHTKVFARSSEDVSSVRVYSIACARMHTFCIH